MLSSCTAKPRTKSQGLFRNSFGPSDQYDGGLNTKVFFPHWCQLAHVLLHTGSAVAVTNLRS